MKSEDIASLPPERNLELTLSEVGLERVQTQVHVQGLLLPALGRSAVSLVDQKSRGIHMSRLFRILSRVHEQELSWPWLASCLEQMLVTHQNLSDSGVLELSFELPVMRKALQSSEQGWRSYPLTYRATSAGGKRRLFLETKVLYSSTCPCSAALSRDAIRDQFLRDFREPQVSLEQVSEWLGKASSMVAVPHAQRSEARAIFELDPNGELPSSLSLIDQMELALGTPVQAAVKREDEQNFARLNAANLMFCEDAARKLKASLNKLEKIVDFQIEVRHFESLHAHDVYARTSKHE